MLVIRWEYLAKLRPPAAGLEMLTTFAAAAIMFCVFVGRP